MGSVFIKGLTSAAVAFIGVLLAAGKKRIDKAADEREKRKQEEKGKN